MLLTFFLILIDVCVHACVRAWMRACVHVCARLNYLTFEKNDAIEMQHNNNNINPIV